VKSYFILIPTSIREGRLISRAEIFGGGDGVAEVEVLHNL
jgi:hypothetical protein